MSGTVPRRGEPIPGCLSLIRSCCHSLRGRWRGAAFTSSTRPMPCGTTGRVTSGKLWDVRTGEEQSILKGHESPISGLAFRPDGTRIYTWDEKVQLICDTKTGLWEAKVLIERWRRDYNSIRPHSSLGYRAPVPEAKLFCSPASAPLQQTSRTAIKQQNTKSCDWCHSWGQVSIAAPILMTARRWDRPRTKNVRLMPSRRVGRFFLVPVRKIERRSLCKAWIAD